MRTCESLEFQRKIYELRSSTMQINKFEKIADDLIEFRSERCLNRSKKHT